ncbi:MAG: GNAT family N-acetyltransferase [Bacteroidota bacterium]
MEFEIKQKEEGVDGAYYIEDKEKEIAEMTYRRRPDKILILHTGVEREYGGRRLGYNMVVRGVEDARKGGYKIKPYCPFAKRVIEGNPDFHDVLDYTPSV